MKQTVIALSLFLFAAAPVFAQNATHSGRKVERLETRLQNIEAQREQFRQRLLTLHDERKQKLTETINNQLNHINQRATTAMFNHLERLQALLNKIKTKAPTVDTAPAQTKISAAKTAVEAQASQEYIIEFTDENGLKVGASSAKTRLRQDIKAVREKVGLARQAVVDALRTAKLI